MLGIADVGLKLGDADGVTETGADDGLKVGAFVGARDGLKDGAPVGLELGSADDGDMLGADDGATDDGAAVGIKLGIADTKSEWSVTTLASVSAVPFQTRK